MSHFAWFPAGGARLSGCLAYQYRLDHSVSNNEVEISGYEIIRRDRNRNGGGVAICLRNNISYVERSDLVSEHVEALCLEITEPKSKPIPVSTWYRPPD